MWTGGGPVSNVTKGVPNDTGSAPTDWERVTGFSRNDDPFLVWGVSLAGVRVDNNGKSGTDYVFVYHDDTSDTVSVPDDTTWWIGVPSDKPVVRIDNPNSAPMVGIEMKRTDGHTHSL